MGILMGLMDGLVRKDSGWGQGAEREIKPIPAEPEVPGRLSSPFPSWGLGRPKCTRGPRLPLGHRAPLRPGSRPELFLEGSGPSRE